MTCRPGTTARLIAAGRGDLEPALTNRRTPPATNPATGDRDAGHGTDALTLLAALATTSVPPIAEDLATGLAWTFDRVTAAIDHATAARNWAAGSRCARRGRPASGEG